MESLCGYGNLELLSTFVPTICMFMRVFSADYTLWNMEWNIGYQTSATREKG